MRISGITRATMLAAALLMLGAGPVMAAGGPPPGVGGGGGGGEVETLGNNLSTPTIFVPSMTGAPALRTPCPTDVVAATGPTTVYNEGAYYLQKTEAVWSAECGTAETATVTNAKWGDNLLNGLAIKTGKPIRVEVGLFTDVLGEGFTVLKLTDELDRYATYGTDGVVDPTMLTRVWAAGSTLTIVKENGDVDQTLVDHVLMTAEINSTGSVVYGYNWGVKGISLPQAGTYYLTFTTPDVVTITGSDAGEAGVVTFDEHSTTVTVVVVGKSGGGGRR